MVLDLRKGICKTEQYEAWKFPGGEIHFKLDKKTCGLISRDRHIVLRPKLQSSDDLMLFIIVSDCIKKDFKNVEVVGMVDYFPYMQADRNFGFGECFSLKTITNIFNNLPIDKFVLFDPHSDVTPSLLDNCVVVDNSNFIKWVLEQVNQTNLIILAPDSGAYKKIFALCEKIKFKGQIECCAKSRNHKTGEKTIIVPKFDETKDVLMIDDICLAGGTFLGISGQIKNRCYLAVSHGIFNNGVEHLLDRFETIYTTDSRCEIINERVKIFKL